MRTLVDFSRPLPSPCCEPQSRCEGLRRLDGWTAGQKGATGCTSLDRPLRMMFTTIIAEHGSRTGQEAVSREFIAHLIGLWQFLDVFSAQARRVQSFGLFSHPRKGSADSISSRLQRCRPKALTRFNASQWQAASSQGRFARLLPGSAVQYLDSELLHETILVHEAYLDLPHNDKHSLLLLPLESLRLVERKDC